MNMFPTFVYICYQERLSDSCQLPNHCKPISSLYRAGFRCSKTIFYMLLIPECLDLFHKLQVVLYLVILNGKYK